MIDKVRLYQPLLYILGMVSSGTLAVKDKMNGCAVLDCFILTQKEIVYKKIKFDYLFDYLFVQMCRNSFLYWFFGLAIGFDSHHPLFLLLRKP